MNELETLMLNWRDSKTLNEQLDSFFEKEQQNIWQE